MIGLWVADVAAAGTVPPSLMDWLAADELARLARIRGGEERRRFLVSRLVLRSAISRAIGVDPKGLGFHVSEDGGKPALSGFPGIDFNLSHSGNAVAVAVSRGHRVGLDIERVDIERGDDEGEGRLDLDAVVGPRSRSRVELEDLPLKEQARAALRLWSLKEAYAKLLGAPPDRDLSELELPREGSRIHLEYRRIRIGEGEYGLALASCPNCGGDGIRHPRHPVLQAGNWNWLRPGSRIRIREPDFQSARP